MSKLLKILREARRKDKIDFEYYDLLFDAYFAELEERAIVHNEYIEKIREIQQQLHE